MNTGTRTDCDEASGEECLSSEVGERDGLILRHLNQVQIIARRIQGRVPSTVKLEDLVSSGIVGLISAIDHYDAARGVKLRTYAEHKIKGAILDFLRELDWAPRQQRKRTREMESAVSELEHMLQRTPRSEEIADCLGLSVADYQASFFEIQVRRHCSFERLPAAEKEDRKDSREIADLTTPLPSQIAEKTQMSSLLGEALQQMSALDHTVLRLYYYDEKPLREIAKLLGVHESRISQLKIRAIQRLRLRMQACFKSVA